jgi:glycosyltransferase involved in cell wall biosynthesis
MDITYLHQYFNTPQTSGGTRSYEMARRLVAAGHQVTMLTSSAGLGESWAPSAGWHSHKVDGIHLEVMHVPYSNKMSFPQRIKAFFRFALGATWQVRRFPADVVFATSTPLTIIIPGLAAKLRHRIPLVFEVRDLWPELPIAMGALRNPLAILAANWLERLAYRTSAHVVALSPGMAEGVMRRGVSASQVTVIPNSCDVELFDVPATRGDWVREQLGLSSEQPLIVYTGTFGLINGVSYLVEVAAALRDIVPEARFLLVGHGLEFDQVTALARQKGVLNHTLWVWPPVMKAQVPDILAAATVVTSLFIPLEPMWDNSANKFFDALAACKPVAINYGGWQADLLREQGAGVVLPPDNTAQAASVLADYIRDLERLCKASAAAKRLAYEQFSRDLLYAKLEKVLQDVVEK